MADDDYEMVEFTYLMSLEGDISLCLQSYFELMLLQKFFESAEKNVTLMNALQEDKLVFFLHLLGIDTNGHSNKPHSE